MSNCDLCSLSKEDCLSVEKIEAGFFIDRTVETLYNIFEDLEQDDGTVLRQQKDYDVRGGVMAKPIPSKIHDVRSVQVLHALLRTFDHFMETAIHVKAGVFKCGESKTSVYNQFLKIAKIAKTE